MTAQHTNWAVRLLKSRASPTPRQRGFRHWRTRSSQRQTPSVLSKRNSDYAVKRALDIAWWAVSDDFALSTDETGALPFNVPGDSGGPLLYGNNITLLISGKEHSLDANGKAVSGKTIFASMALNVLDIRRALSDLGL